MCLVGRALSVTGTTGSSRSLGLRSHPKVERSALYRLSQPVWVSSPCGAGVLACCYPGERGCGDKLSLLRLGAKRLCLPSPCLSPSLPPPGPFAWSQVLCCEPEASRRGARGERQPRPSKARTSLPTVHEDFRAPGRPCLPREVGNLAHA